MTDTLPTPETTPEVTIDTPREARAMVPSTNINGWTGARQKRFLEAVADGHTVRDACGFVSLSPASAYAFRRRDKGRAFDLGWRAADLLARERVAAELMVRATEGQTVEITRADGSVVTKHHYDNRLAVQMLNRLDRYADTSESTAPGHAARMIASDFDSYLDLVGDDAGPARAGLFMLAHGNHPNAAAAELEPVLALARADRHLRCGTRAPDLDVADLDPARRGEWTAEQWTRAEAVGVVALAPPPPPRPVVAPAQPVATRQPVSTYRYIAPEDRAEPVWWDDLEHAWHTRFPPPPGFLGNEDGEYGEEGYSRELDEDELDIVDPVDEAALADREEHEAAARDAWFAGRAALLDADTQEEADADAPPSADVPHPRDAVDPSATPETPEHAPSRPVGNGASPRTKDEIIMDYKKLSLGLGIFSLALAATEVFGAKRITRALEADGHEGLVRGFGAREAAAGIAILTAPALATNIWARVAGDVMDLGTLGLAARNAPRNKAVWGGIVFVVGCTVLDALVAVGLDRQTGKTAPIRHEPHAA